MSADHTAAINAAMKAAGFDQLNHVARKSVEDAVAAYLAERGGDVVVKPLEWKGMVPTAETIVGVYSIGRIGGNWSVALLRHGNSYEAQIASGEAPLFEIALVEAKAAAQADYSARILSAIAVPPAEAQPAPAEHAADLEAQVAFILSDTSRLLREQDVQGVCAHPDDCFYESDRVRCGPCAVKASAAKGVEIDDTHSHLPEVCRLRREVSLANAEIERLRDALTEIRKRIKNARGAIESNQVVDKDVHGTLGRALSQIDAALATTAKGSGE